MSYVNKKTIGNYEVIRTVINCDNSAENPNSDYCVLYTRSEGRLLKLKLFLIRILLPDALFVRTETEFFQKFDEVTK